MLAELRKDDGSVSLRLGVEVLAIDGLPKPTLDRLARLTPPLLIEADVETLDDVKRVVAIGSPRPHPRVAALRAVSDARYAAALESLALLGRGVEEDVELMTARLRAYVGVARVAEAEADFIAICNHPGSDAEAMTKAFEALPAASTATCGRVLAARIVARAADDPKLSCRRLLRQVPLEHWPADALAGGIDEALAVGGADQFDLDDARKMLAVARDRTPTDARLEGASARLEQLAAKLAERGRRQAAKLLAERPDFAAVEALFGVELPIHLSAAWKAHYEGKTVGFGFVEARKGRLTELTELARRLEKDLPPELREAHGSLPHQLFPFAVGEHDEEYFALDLARPSDGDFAVLVVFLGRGGEGWVAYPSSAAWIAGDGITRYD